MTSIMLHNPEEKFMSKSTQGTAVVTGASAGLGRVYADRLAKRGYDLIIVARRGDRLAEIAASVKAQYGVNVSTITADLGKAADLDRVAAQLAADDSITLLVNNAGVSTVAPIGGTTREQFDTMNDVNVKAVARLSHAVLPKFLARNAGTLVNIGSILGFAHLPGGTTYSGTKGYVNHFTRGLQNDIAGTQVRVQLVAPSATATDIWELSGVPLENLNQEAVMSAEDCVDAALAGLDLGETVTLPSVEDAALWQQFEQLSGKLFAAAQNRRPATRYA
jgi:short-subunit dehydrogenase